MNLIREKFIPVRRKSGKKEKIAPWQITETDDPVISLDAPRPDFNGALMQFLIGGLQTMAMRDSLREWVEWLENPPCPEVLKKHFDKKAFAFETKDSPAFMQDFSVEEFEGLSTKAKKKEIAKLLIDSPGDNTIKKNIDLFVKRDRLKELFCPHCTITALFTLQINASPGGQGNRVSLRRDSPPGGPLTTLVISDTNKGRSGTNLCLWENLWLNVLDEEHFKLFYHDESKNKDEDIFPWLAKTRTSENNQLTTPQDVHPKQMYWGMPRRIRICWDKVSQGYCDLCNQESSELIRYYKTIVHGVNYASWRHSLTPYYHKIDKKDKQKLLAQSMKEEKISYQHWLEYTKDSKKNICAKVVTRYSELSKKRKKHLRLYAFGYDIDKMNAKCWYETTFPLFNLDDSVDQDFFKRSQRMITASNESADCLCSAIKIASFRPSKKKGEFYQSATAKAFTKKRAPFFKKQFYQYTEGDFYRLLKELPDKLKAHKDKEILEEWGKILRTKTLNLFEAWVKTDNWMDFDPKRVVEAEKELKECLYEKLKNLLL